MHGINFHRTKVYWFSTKRIHYLEQTQRKKNVCEYITHRHYKKLETSAVLIKINQFDFKNQS